MTFTSAPRGSDLGSPFLQRLSVHLHDLALDLAAGGYTSTTIAMIDRDLRRRTASALGCTVRLDVTTPLGTSPIELHLVDHATEPHEIATALRIPLGQLVAGTHGWVTLYASTAGALDTLRAELATNGVDVDPTSCPPTTTIVPSLTGLDDFSLLNRAVGILINRGHTIDEARRELLRRSTRSGDDLTTTARAVLHSAHYC